MCSIQFQSVAEVILGKKDKYQKVDVNIDMLKIRFLEGKLKGT